MRKFFGTLCLIIAAALLIAAGIYYYPKIKDYADNLIAYHEIRDKYTQDPEPESEDDEDELAKYLRSLGLDPDVYGPIKVDSEGLLEENEDYIGWIYVPKTAISYPVVNPVDNDEYLHADFHKEYNFAGTIFLDANCEDGLENHHTILYGHNMRIGTMFAGLNQFRDQDYSDERPIFWFITPDEYVLYIIEAVNSPNPYDRNYYGIDGFDFMTDKEYQNTIDTIVGNSVVEPSIEREITVEDYIMSLSTCTGNDSVRCFVTGILEKGFDVTTNRTFRKEPESETDSDDETEIYTEENSDLAEASYDVHGMTYSSSSSIPLHAAFTGVSSSSGESVSFSTSDSENEATIYGMSCSESSSSSSGLIGLGLTCSCNQSSSHSAGFDGTGEGFSTSYGSSSGNSIGIGRFGISASGTESFSCGRNAES